ncbi:MAG: GNAT family N-acetyltransferase [Alphaproteobacteria bacterium]|nr:GNAT family N-acetyltransferase [Alphaproteobacteria bacterium]
MAAVWQTYHFAALAPLQLQAIHRARQEVFIVEQNCPYLDADDYDAGAHHLCGWLVPSDAPKILAYLRITPPGSKFAEASLGRVITTAAGRGQGLGKELLRHGLAAANSLYPGQPTRISAQYYLEQFYQSFGFVTVSPIYQEDGIPHVAMLRTGG